LYSGGWATYGDPSYYGWDVGGNNDNYKRTIYFKTLTGGNFVQGMALRMAMGYPGSPNNFSKQKKFYNSSPTIKLS